MAAGARSVAVRLSSLPLVRSGVRSVGAMAAAAYRGPDTRRSAHASRHPEAGPGPGHPRYPVPGRGGCGLRTSGHLATGPVLQRIDRQGFRRHGRPDGTGRHVSVSRRLRDRRRPPGRRRPAARRLVFRRRDGAGEPLACRHLRCRGSVAAARLRGAATMALASCGAGDLAGGYNNSWNDILEFRKTVGGAATVRVQADLVYDTEPGYDFMTLQRRTAASPSFESLTGGQGLSWDGIGTAAVDYTFTYAGSELFEDTDIAVAFIFDSDGAWSDGDCLWPTSGAARLDNIIGDRERHPVCRGFRGRPARTGLVGDTQRWRRRLRARVEPARRPRRLFLELLEAGRLHRRRPCGARHRRHRRRPRERLRPPGRLHREQHGRAARAGLPPRRTRSIRRS